MSTCANCGARLTCGCQKRTLANGKSGCSNCASKVTKQQETQPTKTATPTIRPWGPDRYKNLQKFTKK